MACRGGLCGAGSHRGRGDRTLVATWSAWGAVHRLALVGGAALAYAWHAFLQTPATGHAGMVTRIGNTGFAAGLVILLIIAARRCISADAT